MTRQYPFYSVVCSDKQVLYGTPECYCGDTPHISVVNSFPFIFCISGYNAPKSFDAAYILYFIVFLFFFIYSCLFFCFYTVLTSFIMLMSMGRDLVPNFMEDCMCTFTRSDFCLVLMMACTEAENGYLRNG